MNDKPKLPSEKWWNNTKIMMKHWENTIRANERADNERYIKAAFENGYKKGQADLLTDKATSAALTAFLKCPAEKSVEDCVIAAIEGAIKASESLGGAKSSSADSEDTPKPEKPKTCVAPKRNDAPKRRGRFAEVK